jgi:uncharacterized protein
MGFEGFGRPVVLTIAVAASCFVACSDAASVWKVIGPNGGVLYLGGSIHALKSTDYPLPSSYNRAFDASTRIVFEIDPKDIGRIGKSALKAGEYPKGDSLKKHVDPRTYDYLRRFFALLRVPEEKFSRLRPWYLAALLQSPQLHGLSPDLGVEGFLMRRARANSKPMSGLESLRESVERYASLTDHQSEAMLLLTFIPAEHGDADFTRLKEAWRRGDALTLWQVASRMYGEFPSLAEHEILVRNHNWIPKIEGFLRSSEIHFVVVGAGHMGGPQGLLALLEVRGYKIEQL